MDPGYYQSLLNAATLVAQAAAPPLSQDTRGWQVIGVTFLASFLAQFVKVLTKLVKTGKIDLRMISKTGGMPSSHSCCTVAMAVSVGLVESFNSVSFAIALCLAAIVMYDAAGVRRTVGLQAQVLNKMIEELFSEHPHISSERIKEFLGHTPKEVLVGAIFGVIIAYSFNCWATSRL
jgi:uncharacterized protein